MFPNVRMRSLRSGWHRRVSPPSSTLPDCGEVSARVLRWKMKYFKKNERTRVEGEGKEGGGEVRREEAPVKQRLKCFLSLFHETVLVASSDLIKEERAEDRLRVSGWIYLCPIIIF